MESLFLVVRAPFYALGLALIVTLWTPLMILWASLRLVMLLLVAPILWVSFFLPRNFVKAAFRNRSDEFSTYVKDSFGEWSLLLRDLPKDLWRGYESPFKGLWSWLMRGSQG